MWAVVDELLVIVPSIFHVDGVGAERSRRPTAAGVAVEADLLVTAIRTWRSPAGFVVLTTTGSAPVRRRL